jgi:hypothetical protein
MTDASVPQNDRELLLKLSNDFNVLSDSIKDLSTTLRRIEEKRIGGLEVRLDKIERVWQQVSGAWKFALVLWSILTAGGLVGGLIMLLK